MEHLIATYPVHPKDGCADLADVQQRRQWIQQLKQEDLPQVSKLLHEKWEGQRTSAPAWMRKLLPEQPPPEFWSAEYYAIMGEFVEQSSREIEMGIAEEEMESMMDNGRNLCVGPEELQLIPNPEDSLPPQLFGLIGSPAREIRTRGDGACALHAAFSSLASRCLLAMAFM